MSTALNKENFSYLPSHYLEFLETYRDFQSQHEELSTYISLYNRLLSFLRHDDVAEHVNASLYFEEQLNATFARVSTSFQEEDSNSQLTQSLLCYLVVLWIVICVFGILGNVIVIFVLVRSPTKLIYEIFCIGLAISDLTFLVLVVPITIIHYVFQNWIFGWVLCRVVNYVVYVTIFSSALMLLALTASRFLAVVHPWKIRTMKIREAQFACLGAWIISLLCSLPIPFFYDVAMLPRSTSHSEPHMTCEDTVNWSERVAYQLFTLSVTYLLPFSCIIVMNTLIVAKLKHEVQHTGDTRLRTVGAESSRAKKRRQRSKVTKLVIIITALYCICWLPTHFVNTWYNVFRHAFPFTRSMGVVKFLSQTFSYASCCINPIVYSIFSGVFKSAVRKQFPCLDRARRNQSSTKANSVLLSTQLHRSPNSPRHQSISVRFSKEDSSFCEPPLTSPLRHFSDSLLIPEQRSLLDHGLKKGCVVRYGISSSLDRINPTAVVTELHQSFVCLYTAQRSSSTSVSLSGEGHYEEIEMQPCHYEEISAV